jgi:hypothetical protein
VTGLLLGVEGTSPRKGVGFLGESALVPGTVKSGQR